MRSIESHRSSQPTGINRAAVDRSASSRHKSRHLFEALAISFFFALQIWGWWRVVGAAKLLPEGTLLWTAPCALLASWLCADLASGVIHYVADNWGDESTPLLGPTLIQPFRQHHVDPEAILDHGLLERSGNNAFAALFVFSWVVALPLLSPAVLLLAQLSLLLGIWLLVTNEIHAWAHRRDAPGLVRALQSTGIILQPERHALHHRPPTETPAYGTGNYCITSGVCDRLLHRFRRFRLNRSEVQTPPRAN